MKLFHISDLHIGKRVNEFSMIEDQNYILKEILRLCDEHKPQGIIIAGDIYDKTVPSAEAVELFDSFLVKLVEKGLSIYMISGNHDSAERVSFGGRIMKSSGVHISPVYTGVVEKVAAEDEYGPLNVYLLPYIKPVNIKRFFPDQDISTYTQAVEVAISAMSIKKEERNILVCHQFVTGGERSESEELSIGGLDNVDTHVFDGIDYVALGHLHGPQKVGRDTIRYCGSPLKYSFSEKNHRKSVTVIEMLEKGNVSVFQLELKPLRDMVEIRGEYNLLTSPEFYGDMKKDDYIKVVLTDEEEIPYAPAKLRGIYENIMKVTYDNTRAKTESIVTASENVKEKTPLQLFDELYEKQNGIRLDEKKSEYLKALIEEIWEVKE